jgi:hypothetical protein
MFGGLFGGTTVAPAASIAVGRDMDNVIFEGDVRKQGNVVPNWRHRYFVLWRSFGDSGVPTLQYWKKSSAKKWKSKGLVPVATMLACTS